ncbi:MAG: hypothetical protein V4582_16775 [Pseudomonadota bacterium]
MSSDPPSAAQRKRSKFAACCRRHGFRADQFRISGDNACHSGDPAAPLAREVTVIQSATGRRRRYQRDHFGDWITLFENDLCGGAFSAQGPHW